MQILNDYETYLKEGLYKENTIKTYLRQAESFIKWYRIEKELDFGNEIIRPNFLDFKKWLIEERKNTISSIKVKTHAMQSFNNFLIEKGYQNFSAIWGKDIINLYQSEKDFHILEDVEVENLKKNVKENGNERDIAIIFLFINTGIRVSELLSLELNNYDHLRGEIVVRDGNKIGRIIPVDQETKKALERYLNVRDDDAQTEYFFISKRKQKMGRTRVNQILLEYSEAICPQDLRHYYCVSSLKKGMGVKELSNRAGNISEQFTRKYLEYVCKNGS